MTYEEVQKMKFVGMKDEIHFSCNCCGECCKRREDILLTGYDVIRLTRYLDISFWELAVTYCDIYIGKDSGIPIVRLRTSAVCPFLIKKKCIVQEAKPTICALFPLGRIWRENRAEYFLQDVSCGKADSGDTLAVWLSTMGKEAEVCGKLWTEMLGEAAKTAGFVKNMEEEKQEILQNLLIKHLYDEYDHQKEAKEQMEERLEALKALRRIIEEDQAEES